ncbi:YwmB family TATA-box binding protein [Litchfieldia alkalitelluris]|uniref:YwmB family TATA-box binding protein n=1 Tax=Litchfieldia alkalitelluris TaxID=304268 RepID=UPI0009977B55|nr:YwmB family TATA-box binding protein [Litchfieldia alkalitelluris]
MKLSLSILLLITIVFNFYNQVMGNEHKEMIDELIEIAAESGVEYSSWTVYSRGLIEYVANETELNERFESFIDEHPEFVWKIENEKVDHHFLMKGVKENSSQQLYETIIVTGYLYNGEYEINVAYEITGESWTKEVKQYVYSTYQTKFNDSEMFYTIRGTLNSESENLKKKAEQLLKGFNGELTEGLFEQDFISMSALADEIDAPVMKNAGHEMNLQIGLRANEASNLVDVTIGTPIITTEY